jgi:uncharacterized protein (DUF4213/DUF364 family)
VSTKKASKVSHCLEDVQFKDFSLTSAFQRVYINDMKEGGRALVNAREDS